MKSEVTSLRVYLRLCLIMFGNSGISYISDSVFFEAIPSRQGRSDYK